MINFNCIRLIEKIATNTKVQAKCQQLDIPVHLIKGYTSLEIRHETGLSCTVRYECLNPYGNFWCIDYTMPADWREMTWTGYTSTNSWAGGDRIAVTNIKIQLSFLESGENLTLKEDVIEELDTVIHGKKTFMGV